MLREAALSAAALVANGAALLAATYATPAAEQTPPVVAPVEKADEDQWKITGSVYFLPGDTSADLNGKRQVGSLAAWLGLFHDPDVDTVARAGMEFALPFTGATMSN